MFITPINNQVNSNGLNFTSRNKTIRFADDIARRVGSEYPILSDTKLEGLRTSGQYSAAILRLRRDINSMRSKRLAFLPQLAGDDLIKKWRLYADCIGDNKIGNCSEFAKLGQITGFTNGLEKCRIAELKSTSGRAYDHALVLVQDEKPYIIDPWLGFADYVSNVFARYKRDFANYLGIREGEKLCVEPLDRKLTFTQEGYLQLQKNFPELVLKKN